MHKIGICLLQETWLIRNFSSTINNYRFIYHRLSKHQSSRNEREVGIILSPIVIKAYINANEIPPCTLSDDSTDPTSGRFISIKLAFKGSFKRRCGAFRNKRSKQTSINLIISSIYYPFKDSEHEVMIDFVNSQILS